MTKYIFEHGIFWLTVNFREDPLGFPTSRNMNHKEIAEKRMKESLAGAGRSYLA